MASIKQVKYAKDLIIRNGGNPEEYLLSEDIPGPDISDMINSLLKRELIPAAIWNKRVARYLEEPEVTGPEAFNSELLLIKSLFLRDLVKKTLEKVPEYFYRVAASSTGKYHPKYALGLGGLVRHTKAAVKIAADLLHHPSLYPFTLDERDAIIGALILHDTVKNGLDGSAHTVMTHPLLVERLIECPPSCTEREKQVVYLMIQCIKTHMGPWVNDRDGTKILEEPKSEAQLFTHLCDYLASRKFLEVSFD